MLKRGKGGVAGREPRRGGGERRVLFFNPGPLAWGGRERGAGGTAPVVAASPKAGAWAPRPFGGGGPGGEGAVAGGPPLSHEEAGGRAG